MKKIIIVLSLLIIFLLSNNATEDIIIPDDAIRIRVIANSNSASDQTIKQMVRTAVEEQITEMMSSAKDIDDARQILTNNIDSIDATIENILLNNKIDTKYEVDFGYNYFPNKKYKGVIYEEGYYESVVVTLGQGKGDNWWCVLFPPLCMMESNDSIEEVEYKSFIKELIDKYF